MISSNHLFPLAVVFSAFFTRGIAWETHADCTGKQLELINKAMPEALNMAIYAKYRAQTGKNSALRLGTSLQNFLGAPDENDQASLDLIQTWMQKVFDVGSAPVNVESGVLIHCSDAHLKRKGETGRKYIDYTRGKAVQVNLPTAKPGFQKTDTPCGGWMQGFEYPGVIVLCNDGPHSAFAQSTNGPTLEFWRTKGDMKSSPSIADNGIDAMSQYLSTKILHELMHAASDTLPFGQDRQFPQVLPDTDKNGNEVTELYGYQMITGYADIGVTDPPPKDPPSVNNLQHNADSWALLGVYATVLVSDPYNPQMANIWSAWYIPRYAWVNGEVKTIGKPRQAPDMFPGQPTAPGSSNSKRKQRSFRWRR